MSIFPTGTPSSIFSTQLGLWYVYSESDTTSCTRFPPLFSLLVCFMRIEMEKARKNLFLRWRFNLLASSTSCTFFPALNHFFCGIVLKLFECSFRLLFKKQQYVFLELKLASLLLPLVCTLQGYTLTLSLLCSFPPRVR